MKKLSTYTENKLQELSLKAYVVVDLNIGAAVYRATSLPYPVTIGGVSYNSNLIKLVGIDYPHQQDSVSRNSYSILLSDLSRDLENLWIAGSGFGSPLTVRVGFLPSLEPEDMIIIYKGYIDTILPIDQEESKLLKITGVSPAGNLSYRNPFYNDDDYGKQRNPGDQSFEMVGTTSEESIRLGWGRVDAS
jgi:hypothetical protein